MKNLHLIFLCLVVAWIGMPEQSISQDDSLRCGTIYDPNDPQQQIDLEQRGGIYLTSDGLLKVLVVFVSFPDDNTFHPHWPVGSPPNNLDEFIDPDETTNRTNEANLTHYYRKMSLELFHVVGEAIWVEAPEDWAWYQQNNYSRYDVNRDVLTRAVDQLVNFTGYDNWTYVANYDNRNEPDGVVDMIVMVYRGFRWYLGEASLGYGETVTLDGVDIAFGYRGYADPGSGVTCSYPYSYWHRRALHIMIHEVGHWILGLPHPYDSYEGNGDYAFWAMMSGTFPGDLCANAWERERLRWINAIPITETVVANLPDFITSGIAYKYHPTSGSTNEYYYFENHQKLSVYDGVTTNSTDKGIFVLHQQGAYNDADNIRVKPTDGFWNWENPSFNTTCFPPSEIAVFRKQSINRVSGRSIRSSLLNSRTPPLWEWPHGYLDKTNAQWCGGFFRGDPPFFGAYNLIEEKVISPWSNPTTHTWSGSQTTFAMEVLSQSGDVVNVKFHTSSPENTPPSKPEDLRISVQNQGGDSHPKLDWAAMQEPDVITGGKLFIHRRTKVGSGSWSAWALRDSVAGTEIQYVDNQITTAGGGPDSLQYKIQARDSQSKLSVFSDVVSMQWFQFGSKPSAGDDPLPERFNLEQNYPNPFNPSTTVRYALPVDAHVVLKIYNMLGQEITTLVGGEQKAGWYQATFDGSFLSGGMYLYRLQAGDFIETRKMLLLK